MATGGPGRRALSRTGRRERALAQMEAHDLDILILGRQSNIRYVSGAQQLWVAGTRPFAPSCVLLRNGAVHLLSTWDEGCRRTSAREPLRHRLEPDEHHREPQEDPRCGHRPAGGIRCLVAGFRPTASDGVPERRTGRRRARDPGRPADQDRRGDRDAARIRAGRRGRPGRRARQPGSRRLGAGSDRRRAGSDDRGRGEHPAHQDAVG